MSSRTDASDRLLVPTFHAISDAVEGPVGIAPETFRMQMRALAEAGYRSLRLAEFIEWHGGAYAGGPCVLITFDDAYCDFADNAVPILCEFGFSAVNFVPSALVGGVARWNGALRPARGILSWSDLRDLSASGMEFGAHGRTHRDLTQLEPKEREREIAGSRAELADGLGAEVTSFAAPYGAVNEAVIDTTRRYFRTAFGVRLARAARSDDRFDIPRIDMHYFRSERAWRGLLQGRLAYLTARAAGRKVRASLFERVPA